MKWREPDLDTLCTFCGSVSSLKGEGNMSEFSLHIEGMHCGACVRRVSQALSQTPGLEVKEVQIGAARLASEQNPPPVDRAIAALAAAGYKAQPDPASQPGA
jgi:copper chaperone